MRLPAGEPCAGPVPLGGALRRRGWRSRAAEPAGSLRGRNVPQEALPPPEDEPGDSAGDVGLLSGCFGYSAVIKGSPAGKDPPVPQLFPSHRRVIE